MKFVTLPVSEAEGGLLAHALSVNGWLLPKGFRLAADDTSRLQAAAVENVTVAMVEANDVFEDAAAERVARALAGSGLRVSPPQSGRCDIVAGFDGLILFDAAKVHALNRLDDAITLATLSPHETVFPGQTAATVKVNPFAAPEALVAAWEAFGPLLRLAAFLPHRVALIQTVAPSLKPSLLQKTSRVTRARLDALGGALCADTRAPHEEDALAREIGVQLRAGADLILICGARSTADRKDVVPAAIVAAGGDIEVFGMPVYPGNLLTLGSVGDVRIVGMPGCARTTQLNGFDFVLQRLLAKQKLGRDEIAAMGVGGLLHASPRPVAPRLALGVGRLPGAPRKIAAVVLAAGQSRRMGANKLTMTLEGKPVVGHVMATIEASRLAAAIVVLGHEAENVRAALAPAAAKFVVNHDFQAGLATSLKAGIAALPPDIDGAMIFLGDMPDIDPALVDRMIDAFDPACMRAIVVPRRNGRQGHPVLWGRGFFPILLQETHGDSGAKHLMTRYADWMVEIEADDESVFTDLDTPDAFGQRKKAREPAS
jgi:molybdenum cofactor cytidylyltransferase